MNAVTNFQHMEAGDVLQLYSVQPKVSIQVDGATELGTKISQSEAAAANVRVIPEPAGTQVCH